MCTTSGRLGSLGPFRGPSSQEDVGNLGAPSQPGLPGERPNNPSAANHSLASVLARSSYHTFPKTRLFSILWLALGEGPPGCGARIHMRFLSGSSPWVRLLSANIGPAISGCWSALGVCNGLGCPIGPRRTPPPAGLRIFPLIEFEIIGNLDSVTCLTRPRHPDLHIAHQNTWK